MWVIYNFQDKLGWKSLIKLRISYWKYIFFMLQKTFVTVFHCFRTPECWSISHFSYLLIWELCTKCHEKHGKTLFSHTYHPYSAQRPKYRTFDQNFNFNLRRDPQKNFLWASHLWVGRRKEPILGPEKRRKKVFGHKWVKTRSQCFQIICASALCFVFTFFWNNLHQYWVNVLVKNV